MCKSLCHTITFDYISNRSMYLHPVGEPKIFLEPEIKRNTCFVDNQLTQLLITLSVSWLYIHGAYLIEVVFFKYSFDDHNFKKDFINFMLFKYFTKNIFFSWPEGLHSLPMEDFFVQSRIPLAQLWLEEDPAAIFSEWCIFLIRVCILIDLYHIYEPWIPTLLFSIPVNHLVYRLTSTLWTACTEKKVEPKPLHPWSRFMVCNSAPHVALFWCHLQRWSCFGLKRVEPFFHKHDY